MALWNTSSYVTDMTFTGGATIATSSGSTGYAQCTSALPDNSHSFTIARTSSTKDNLSYCVTSDQAETDMLNGGCPVLIEPNALFTSANLYDGTSGSWSLVGTIDPNDVMLYDKSGTDWRFKVDGVVKVTSSDTGTLYLRTRIQNPGLATTLTETPTPSSNGTLLPPPVAWVNV